MASAGGCRAGDVDVYPAGDMSSSRSGAWNGIGDGDDGVCDGRANTCPDDVGRRVK